jgi:hypothetical protein
MSNVKDVLKVRSKLQKNNINNIKNLTKFLLFIKGGCASFFLSLQIANPQILRVHPHLQNCKFLRYAILQISNPQISFD